MGFLESAFKILDMIIDNPIILWILIILGVAGIIALLVYTWFTGTFDLTAYQNFTANISNSTAEVIG
jgi:hypothetical protein